MKKVLRVMSLIMVGFALLGLASCGGSSDTIKLGSTGPLSGEASIYGIAVKEGIELAIEEINKAGGVNVAGVMKDFELVDFINDEADADKAGAGLAALLEAKTDVIVGAVTSGATEGLIAEAVKVGIPVITPTGTADKLTVGDKGDERDTRANIFRACFYDSYQGEYMAEYAADKGMKTAYVLFNNDDDYSVGLKDAFVKTAKNVNLEVTAVGYGKEIKDFSSYWAPIIDGKFDCVYVPDYYENVYNILKTGYGAGYDGVCYGGDGWDGVVKQVKEGDDVSFLEKCYYSNHFFSGSTNENVQNFVDKYEEKYGETPVSFAALAYDAVYVVKQAIEEAGEVDYDVIVEALNNTTFKNLVTSAGDFKFDANGNPKKAAIVITFKDGKEVEAK